MKSFKQYLRQTLYESDPQKYDDVGKKIDNETSEVPVWRGWIPPSEWRGGIPPSEIVDDQVWQTDEEIEKDEEQQAKKQEEKQAKRWVKRYNEKLMTQQQERRMQPPLAPGARALARDDRLDREEIWNRSQNKGVKFLPDPERVRQQEWYDRQHEYEPETWDPNSSEPPTIRIHQG